MKREIKFRVWDDLEFMSNPFTLEDLILKRVQLTHDCIVMQFTGLHDRNGVEIYEGDIVRFDEWDDEDDRVIVYKKYGFTYSDTFYDFEGLLYNDEVTVIGNIYENPELLQK